MMLFALGGSIILHPTSSMISARTDEIYIYERCNYADSLDLGGYWEGEANMALSRHELSRLTSSRIYFDSVYGNITVFGIDHPNNNMSSVTDWVSITALHTGSFSSYRRRNFFYTGIGTIFAFTYFDMKISTVNPVCPLTTCGD